MGLRVECEVLLAHDLKLMTESDFQRVGPEATRIKRMLASLLNTLRVPAEQRTFAERRPRAQPSSRSTARPTD